MLYMRHTQLMDSLLDDAPYVIIDDRVELTDGRTKAGVACSRVEKTYRYMGLQCRVTDVQVHWPAAGSIV